MPLVNKACEGVGLGLRPPHLYHVLREKPAVPWFEVHICNYLQGGINRRLLQEVGEHYPLSFHGVSLNLGGTDPLDLEYLSALKRTESELQPGLVSEHACFTANASQHFHDLLPVPYTEEAIHHFAARITQVQDYLGRQIAIENLSRYRGYEASELSEAEFLAALAERADCLLLLDLNNLYVNQQNLGESAADFIATLPQERISEVHLAGHDEINGQLVDTHGTTVCDEVWRLFSAFAEDHPNIPTLIEWDSNLPEFPTLMAEKEKAERLIRE